MSRTEFDALIKRAIVICRCYRNSFLFRKVPTGIRHQIDRLASASPLFILLISSLSTYDSILYFPSSSMVSMETEPLVPRGGQYGAECESVAVAEYMAEIESDDDIKQNEDWMDQLENLHITKSPRTRLLIFGFLIMVAVAVPISSADVLYYKLACQGLSTPSQKCNPVESQQLVTDFLMWKGMVSLVISVATSMWISRLSDIYGRKIFIGAIVACFFSGHLVEYLAMSNSDHLPFWWLIFAAVIKECCGGTLAINVLLKAYVTDTTRAEKRSAFFGYIQASAGVGVIVGPAINLLINRITNVPDKDPNFPDAVPRDHHSSDFAPIQASIVFLGICGIYTFTCLPESRSSFLRMKSRRASMSASNNAVKTSIFTGKWWFTTLVEPLTTLLYPEDYSKRPENHTKRVRKSIVMLIISSLVYNLTLSVNLNVEVQYAIFRFSWNASNISFYLASNSIVSVFVFTVISPILLNSIIPCFPRLSTVPDLFDDVDCLIMCGGFIISALTAACKALTPNATLFLIFTLLENLSLLSMPTTISAAIKPYPSDKIGEFFGALSVIDGISQFFFQFIASKVYSLGVKLDYPALAYILAAVASIVSVLLSFSARWSVSGLKSTVPDQ